MRSRDEISEEKAVAKGERQMVLKHAVIAKLNHSQPTLRKMADASTFEECETILTSAVEAADQREEEREKRRMAEHARKVSRQRAKAEKEAAELKESERRQREVDEATIKLAGAFPTMISDPMDKSPIEEKVLFKGDLCLHHPDAWE